MAQIKNLLPVGSVVKLKGLDKKVSVMGILINNGGTRRDYIAVPFPEGFIDTEHRFVFDHDDIEKVDYLGYINSEFQLFRGTLAENLEKGDAPV